MAALALLALPAVPHELRQGEHDRVHEPIVARVRRNIQSLFRGDDDQAREWLRARVAPGLARSTHDRPRVVRQWPRADFSTYGGVHDSVQVHAMLDKLEPRVIIIIVIDSILWGFIAYPLLCIYINQLCA